ncbi:MAG: oxidoreductase [Pseudonocardiales bacterium]|nr:oxidoreductase [Pseudonocardiales bacterium]
MGSANAGPTARADIVIVGAGIVGLGHAVAAMKRGLSVVVVERNERPIGASVRNFGHGCFTAQHGDALRYATKAREIWISLAKAAGFWLRESGTVVIARAEDEYAVLEDFSAARNGGVTLLDADNVRARVPTKAAVTGGAYLAADIRVDPRQAAPAIAAWLASKGVQFQWSTALTQVAAGIITTSRGAIEAPLIVVAVGHDVDRHFPEIAAGAQLQRCVLHMLRIANPTGTTIDPAVLTGFSLLRYAGFAVSPALETVRQRLAKEDGDAVAAGVNLMFTQLPNGDLTIGDTHAYAVTPSPFQAENADEIILDRISALIGSDRLTVRERWRGIYASAPEPFLLASPDPQTRVVSVTSGIGMTTALGLAEEVIDDLVG